MTRWMGWVCVCGIGLSWWLSAGALVVEGQTSQSSTASYVGFDRNGYPGDAALPALRRHFAFVGYWLNTPPGARTNDWAGKRETLRTAGFGFLVLWNGRLDREILKLQRSGTKPAELGARDGAAAIAAARAEHFREGTILFLDQEEGGRMLPEQAGYLLAWTETVARSGFRAGVYASGQPVDEGPAPGGGPHDDYDRGRHHRAREGGASAPGGAVGGAGRVSAGERVHADGAAAEPERDGRGAGVAVRAESATAGDHAGVREDVRRERQLRGAGAAGGVSRSERGGERGSVGRAIGRVGGVSQKRTRQIRACGAGGDTGLTKGLSSDDDESGLGPQTVLY